MSSNTRKTDWESIGEWVCWFCPHDDYAHCTDNATKYRKFAGGVTTISIQRAACWVSICLYFHCFSLLSIVITLKDDTVRHPAVLSLDCCDSLVFNDQKVLYFIAGPLKMTWDLVHEEVSQWVFAGKMYPELCMICWEGSCWTMHWIWMWKLSKITRYRVTS